MSLQGTKKQQLDGLRFGQAVLPPLLRDNPFGQIIDPLKIPSLANGKLTRGPQRGCHPFDQFQIPPAAAPTAFHVEGANGPFIPNTPAQVFCDLGVLPD